MLNKSSKVFARNFLFKASLFLLCILCFGCAASEKQTVKGAYDEAYALYGQKSYLRAKTRFEDIILMDPLNKYAVLSELHLAEIMYEEEDYDSSLVHYEEYLRLNPKADEYEYIKYRIAMCHFGMIATYDRDQTETELALKDFRDYFNAYPDGKYLDEIKSSTDHAMAVYLRSEYNVSEFYYKMDKYEAAVTRCDNILMKHKKGDYLEETYLILVKSLDKLSKEDRLLVVYEEYLKRFPEGRLQEELSGVMKDRS